MLQSDLKHIYGTAVVRPRSSGKCKKCYSLLIPILILCILCASATAPIFSDEGSFTEDFSTDTYKDAANTTADWDMASGVLKLGAGGPGPIEKPLDGTRHK